MTIIGEEMKPCPFCGGEARTLPTLRRVFCTTPDCGAEMGAVTQAGAVMLWNTRSPEAVTVMREALADTHNDRALLAELLIETQDRIRDAANGYEPRFVELWRRKIK